MGLTLDDMQEEEPMVADHTKVWELGRAFSSTDVFNKIQTPSGPRMVWMDEDS